MHRTIEVIQKGKQLRIIGFDDAPFEKTRGSLVNISGVVCADTRIEGMLWSEVSKDGLDSTEVLIADIIKSKYYQQLHAILLDGIAFGGFNIVNLPSLVKQTGLPCIAVMRRVPNMESIMNALSNFSDSVKRVALLDAAGPIIEQQGFVFQALGIDVDNTVKLLTRVTDTGKVPEALRLAHLIGSAIKTGESGNRA